MTGALGHTLSQGYCRVFCDQIRYGTIYHLSRRDRVAPRVTMNALETPTPVVEGGYRRGYKGQERISLLAVLEQLQTCRLSGPYEKNHPVSSAKRGCKSPNHGFMCPTHEDMIFVERTCGR